MGEHAAITVEVLDERFRPLPGWSGDACVPLREPGLRQPVVWKDRDSVSGIDGPFRLRVTFDGLRPPRRPAVRALRGLRRSPSRRAEAPVRHRPR